MTDLTSLTLAEARDCLRAREFSSAEITKAHLEAMEGGEALNAYVAATPEKALEMAKASDARLPNDGRLVGSRSFQTSAERPAAASSDGLTRNEGAENSGCAWLGMVLMGTSISC